MMSLFSLFLLTLLFPCLFAAPNWSDFRVSWPTFTKLPFTVNDATAAGWQLDTSKSCASGFVMGNRYYLPTTDNPLALFLIMNSQGQIAGVQGGSQLQPPVSTISPSGPWVKDQIANITLFTTTMYFRDPSTLCTSSTNSTIGDGLWFLEDGRNTTIIESQEKNLPVGAGTWGKGKCFATMGNHYWFNLSPSASCDSLLPLFLLYNQGQLNGFGWALDWGQQPGKVWEHPQANQLNLFFADGQQPNCFQDQGRIFSTMHFYLTNPIFDFC